MMAVDEYGKITSENSKKPQIRDRLGGPRGLAQGNRAAPFAKKEKPNENHHICLIVGYNEATDELAVSDSWARPSSAAGSPPKSPTGPARAAFS